jgi:hypothetical protein
MTDSSETMPSGTNPEEVERRRLLKESLEFDIEVLSEIDLTQEEAVGEIRSMFFFLEGLSEEVPEITEMLLPIARLAFSVTAENALNWYAQRPGFSFAEKIGHHLYPFIILSKKFSTIASSDTFLSKMSEMETSIQKRLIDTSLRRDIEVSEVVSIQAEDDKLAKKQFAETVAELAESSETETDPEKEREVLILKMKELLARSG